MAKKFRVITNHALQIEGLEGVTPGDTVIAMLETDCNAGSIWSSLQFGNARLEEFSNGDKSEGSTSPSAQTSTPEGSAPGDNAKPTSTRRKPKAPKP